MERTRVRKPSRSQYKGTRLAPAAKVARPVHQHPIPNTPQPPSSSLARSLSSWITKNKEVKPSKLHELKPLFQAADDEEKLWMSHFLNTGCHEQEVANADYCDLLDDVNVGWIRSKPHRVFFKFKGKRCHNKGSKLPVPTAPKERLRTG
jgi:hypothetical protein